MVYKRFYITIIIRILLLVLSSILLIVFLYETQYIYTVILFVGILGWQTYSMINYLNKTNRHLARFLIYLKSNDTTLNFPQATGNGYDKELTNYFNEILTIIRNVRIEKEYQFQYLGYVVEHIGIGLIAFDTDGKIELYNKAVNSLLSINALSNINSLDKIQNGFSNTLKNIKLNEQKLLVVKINNELLQISINASEFIIKNKKIKLISLQDIKAELNEQELISWQKLIKVLTHEIMNSITPITTLTKALIPFYKKDDIVIKSNNINNEIIKDTIDGLELIEERGTGLIEFVNNYRSLTRLPKPQLKNIVVSEIFNKLYILFQEDIKTNKIGLIVDIEPSNIEIIADEIQIEQVLINLIKNAIEALHTVNNRRIILKAFKEKERTFIQILNNGSAIPENIIENIFIPFFTTKAEGSGIGLSLSQQIMRQHKGTLTVKSIQNKNTIFTLKF